ncbi:MAG: 1-(5-phosphoribosyl)-5-[Clostridia bacterium]|nr:1-(5-phosphoribosyl)-5-[(5-phosphoribosylamino)methylideneamino]imidazole-4-carboxamide isomerase [Clostridia bacterium]
MIIFPATDLLGGRCVRLCRGEYDTASQVADDALEAALEFERGGAEWLHAVDLDAARGRGDNAQLLARMVEVLHIPVEIGGGIRSLETAEKYLNAGAARVIIGSAAVKKPELMAQAARAFGDKVALGADCRNEMVAVQGWTETTDLTVFTLLEQAQQAGIGTAIVTDIACDGMLQGPNTELMRRLQEAFPHMQLIASGGVTTAEQIRQLAQMGLYGAICGKALYSGSLTLQQALEAAR